MPRSAKALTVGTAAALILVTAYTVALGSSGWLWLGWAVLALITVGALSTKRS